MNVEKFARRLKEARLKKELTLYELGNLAGVAESYICHLEKGNKTNPSQKLINRLSEILDIDSYYLTGKTDYQNGKEILDLLMEHDFIEKDVNDMIDRDKIEKIISAFNSLKKED
jgi:transcriptional regulator with XRE-family HTH domain